MGRVSSACFIHVIVELFKSLFYLIATAISMSNESAAIDLEDTPEQPLEQPIVDSTPERGGDVNEQGE